MILPDLRVHFTGVDGARRRQLGCGCLWWARVLGRTRVELLLARCAAKILRQASVFGVEGRAGRYRHAAHRILQCIGADNRFAVRCAVAMMAMVVGVRTMGVARRGGRVVWLALAAGFIHAMTPC